jgi:hypothetical protein
MININSEKELISFLKILTEESVKKSKNTLKEEEDPFSSYYSKKRKEEKELFEQEEAPEDLPEKPPSSTNTVEEDPKTDMPEKTDASDEEAFVGSKDRLVDFVNDIRSAPSIKDSAVSEQIDAYYDRLSQEEKDVLVFFLRELSRVMTGKASGQDARDPSDPPLNIDFVHKDEKPSPESEETSAPPKLPSTKATSPEEESNNVDFDQEEEDTTPPIKVNESQDHSLLRAKIKKLLG